MSDKYDIVFESFQNEIGLIQIYDECGVDIEPAAEGENFDIAKVIIPATRRLHAITKEISKGIKKNEFTQVSKLCDSAVDEIDVMIRDLEKIEPRKSGAYVGYIIAAVRVIISFLIQCGLTKIINKIIPTEVINKHVRFKKINVNKETGVIDVEQRFGTGKSGAILRESMVNGTTSASKAALQLGIGMFIPEFIKKGGVNELLAAWNAKQNNYPDSNDSKAKNPQFISAIRMLKQSRDGVAELGNMLKNA